MAEATIKALRWIASAKRDFDGFPRIAKVEAGYALYLAQCGDKHRNAKPLKGFGGASVLEIVLDAEGNAYRVAYSIGIGDAVHVLHAFMKKARKGRATPTQEIETIKRRLRMVKEQYS
jgi:phage-related protein